jgi:hypothetical protein
MAKEPFLITFQYEISHEDLRDKSLEELRLKFFDEVNSIIPIAFVNAKIEKVFRFPEQGIRLNTVQEEMLERRRAQG